MSSIKVTIRGLVKAQLTFSELDEGEFFTTVNEPGTWYIKASPSSMNKPIAVRLNSGYGTTIGEGEYVIPLSPSQVIEITNK